MPPTLPTELILSILGFLTHERSVARCCRLSRAFLPLMRQRLYRDITFGETETSYPDFASGAGAEFGDWRHSPPLHVLNERSTRLYHSLCHNYYLSSLPRRVIIDTYQSADTERAALLDHLLEQCPYAESVALRSLGRGFCWAEGDHQQVMETIRRLLPRLKELRIEEWTSRSSEGKLEAFGRLEHLKSLRIDAMDAEHFKDNAPLQFHLQHLHIGDAIPPATLSFLTASSLPSLRDLTLTIDEYAYDLTSYSSLSSLSLRIALVDWDAQDEHEDLARNLSSTLATCPPSVTSIAIMDVGQTARLDVLDRTRVLDHLPPSLSRLDLGKTSLGTEYLLELFAKPSFLPSLSHIILGGWIETDFRSDHYLGVQRREEEERRAVERVFAERAKGGREVRVQWMEKPWSAADET
ncbi:hypothetical protein BCR35DRAFT_352566 [Leucosporidium creatinivorum]|uniref:F-box domain-containing protein n=1 Tax=Leucosporidium creatinivorum TaxID=106004 RepID=A0A1Y2F8K2_9BASI|nr:hypothetical protein BCR35DRAFT_352566 [Leucosporidium creatinivorum]